MQVTYHQPQCCNRTSPIRRQAPIDQPPLIMWPPQLAIGFAVITRADAWLCVKDVRIETRLSTRLPRRVGELDGGRKKRILATVKFGEETLARAVAEGHLDLQVFRAQVAGVEGKAGGVHKRRYFRQVLPHRFK